MKYLLDTNAIIALLKGHSGLLTHLQQHSPDKFGISALVIHELFYGAYKSQKIDKNLAVVNQLQFEVLELDTEDAKQAAEIRAYLAIQGTPIGPYDVLIAGQARARNLTLITHNLREFARIPKLSVEDWEQ